MPGLSNYRPPRGEDEYYEVWADDPTADVEHIDSELRNNPEILENMRRRYQESLGFADLKRTAADELFHSLYNAIPRKHLDDSVRVMFPGGFQGANTSDGGLNPKSDLSVPDWSRYGSSGHTNTWRTLLEVLKNLRPAEELQGQ